MGIGRKLLLAGLLLTESSVYTVPEAHQPLENDVPQHEVSDFARDTRLGNFYQNKIAPIVEPPLLSFDKSILSHIECFLTEYEMIK